MVLLYIVAGCVLVCLGFAEDIVYDDESYSKNEYPNPRAATDYVTCRRKVEESYICDPNQLLTELEADQLNEQLVDIVNELRCPCSRYACLENDEGYKIAIALMKKMKPGKTFDEWDAEKKTEKNWEEKKREWLLDEAKSFAEALQGKWNLEQCSDDVIVLYSLDDGVLFTAVGKVAGRKLNASVINDVSEHARSQFTDTGSIFKGLFKMIRDYRSVFEGNYQMGRPHTGAQRSLAMPMMTCSSSFTAAVMLLLSAFAVVLCRDVVSGTQ